MCGTYQFSLSPMKTLTYHIKGRLDLLKVRLPVFKINRLAYTYIYTYIYELYMDLICLKFDEILVPTVH